MTHKRAWLRWLGWTLLSAMCLFATPSQPADAQGQLVLKVATSAHPQSPWGLSLSRLRRHIETQSRGRIRVRVFYSATLGADTTQLERVIAGTLQAYAGPVEALFPTVNALRAVEQPYLFRSERDAERALGAATTSCRALLEPAGLRFGGWQTRGFRSWLSTERPVLNERDLRATPVNALPHRLDFLRAAGLEPVVSTSPTELYEVTLTEAAQRGLHLRARHVTLTEHAYAAGVIVYSKVWFDGLAAKTQELLTSAPGAVNEPVAADVAALEARLIEAMKQRGVDVHVPDTAEARSLGHSLRAATDDALRDLSESGRALYRQLRAH